MSTKPLQVGGYVVAVAILGFALTVSLGTAEFGAAVDGIGYGFVAETWVRNTFLGFWFLAVLAVPIWLVRNAKNWFYVVGFVPVFVFLPMISWFGMMPLHYARFCDTADAPNACRAATWRVDETCIPGEACFERMEKACRLGNGTSCEALKERGFWTHDQMCTSLQDRCVLAMSCEVPGGCRENDGLPYFEQANRFDCLNYEHHCQVEVDEHVPDFPPIELTAK